MGVVTIASRIFEALLDRYTGTILTIAKEISKDKDPIAVAHRLKHELRLAALLHDTGHSLFSHASERVYSRIGILQGAAQELSDLIGKEKGAGEVLSFCIANSRSVASLISRARKRVEQNDCDEEGWSIDLNNVALLIVGSSAHPHLQFMGDIISSGLDADKLDYLLRDASSAGLPLKYDLERYLYTVALEKDYMVDLGAALTRLYAVVGTKVSARPPVKDKIRFPFYDTYRLRLPKRASSTMEQIVICKVMLFSYIYHHQKVRAAEGLFEKLLTQVTDLWSANKIDDLTAIFRFMEYDDSSMHGQDFLQSPEKGISEASYRILNRVLPREVYRFSPAISHSGGELIKEFFLMLRERDKRAGLIADLEGAFGEELVRIDNRLTGKTAAQALWTAGAWVDVPKPPKVEEVELSTGEYPALTIENLFPIEEWTEAYQAHRYYVRVYAYSEYVESAAKAARSAVERVIGIREETFFESCLRKR